MTMLHLNLVRNCMQLINDLVCDHPPDTSCLNGKVEDGTQVSVEEFTRKGGKDELCTHITVPVGSENGEWQIYFHIQDTPGYA